MINYIEGLKLNKWYFVEYTWHHKRGAFPVYVINNHNIQIK